MSEQIGPQRGPSSPAKIKAEQEFYARELSEGKCATMPSAEPAPSPPALAKLDESCAAGIYECQYRNSDELHYRFWDGKNLLYCRNDSYVCTNEYRNFTGPLVIAGAAEQRLAEVELERDELREASWLQAKATSELADDKAVLKSELATLKSDRDSIQATIDHFDAEAAKLYPPHKWQYCEAICCLLGDAEKWKAELERLRASAGREDGEAEPIDEVWLLQRGAFHNSGEIVLPLVMNGVTNQLRFVHDILKPDWISCWYLFPSTGEGRIWLPASNRPGPEFGRCIFPKAVHKLASALGINLEKGG